MTDNLKKLLELVSQNEELQKKLQGLNKDEFIAAAKDLGIELTEADLSENAEISDDELDAVAGGGTCVCVAGGGGKRSNNDKSCGCFMGGWGYTTDRHERCLCVVGGSGYNT